MESSIGVATVGSLAGAARMPVWLSTEKPAKGLALFPSSSFKGFVPGYSLL